MSSESVSEIACQSCIGSIRVLNYAYNILFMAYLHTWLVLFVGSEFSDLCFEAFG